MRKDNYNRLKELRERLGLTQQELAEDLGISRQSLISLEKGKFMPSFPLTIILEDFFAQPIRDIFKFNNQKGGEMRRDCSAFEDLNRVHRELDRAFDEGLGQTLESAFPKINLYTRQNRVIVEAEVSGMTEKDLEINVTQDSVRIAGEKKEVQEVKKKDYYRRESSYGRFDRQVALPAVVDNTKAEAEIKDGTLRVTIPMAKGARAKAKKLKIKRKK